MRHLVFISIAAALLWCPAPASAQENLPPEIKNIYVGFQSYQEKDPTAFKVGLWTPVHVEVFGGTDGIAPIRSRPHLVIETVDSEDVGTQIHVKVNVEPLQSRTFTGYVKTGHMSQSNEIRIHLNVNNKEYKPKAIDAYRSVNIDQQLYVTLGTKITDLHRAVQKMGQRENKERMPVRGESGMRHVAYESSVERLPDYWFGYNSADLLFLSTDNRPFLNQLRNHPEKLRAMAQWVRRGGRLVVPIAPQSQDVVAALLEEKTAWDPPIPVVPPALGDAQVARLSKVEDWGAVLGHPFYRVDPQNPQQHAPIAVAKLDRDRIPPGAWEVWAEGSDSRDVDRTLPLIARVRYGLGQIVYLAFSLEDKHFVDWTGKEKFLQTMVTKLATRTPIGMGDDFGRGVPNDLTTDLLGQLDNFDIAVIPFGYVALFIILYILVVGPLDFFLLKYVFKRLEWTWVTFPSVVLGVSVIAYFTAYALKGRDLKINKVDIVDFDLRTDLGDAERKPTVHAYGQSFFTILSPRIQNYTIGLEPNPLFWGASADKVESVDLLSWMGRPSGGANDMGRAGSPAFFRKPYTFREDASGLEGVPIPVWTSKAFSASWEKKLRSPPFSADLVYHQKEFQGQDLKITGKLENHLGVDLIDVCLIYADRCYPIPQGLKSVQRGAPPAKLSISTQSALDMRNWVDQPVPQEERVWSSNPTRLVKELLFHERYDTQNAIRNHLLRPLDLGWRILEERDHRDQRTREAILFARVAFAGGPAETLTRDLPLPTKLWLGELPGDPTKTRPDLIGHLNQDTYIRVLLPVRPVEEK